MMFKTYEIAHFLNQKNKKVNFYIDLMDTMPEPENMVFPHKHSFYEILLITSGNSTQNIDYQVFEMQKNDLFFISKGQLHLFEDWATIDGYCLFFTEDFLLLNNNYQKFWLELLFLDNLHQKPFLSLTQASFLHLKSYFDLLKNEFERETPNEEAQRALLFVLLTEIQRLYQNQNPILQNTAYTLIFKQFIQLLENHFRESLTAKNYADLLNISNRHLNLVCQTIVNQPITQLIQNRKILEAKRLLSFTDWSIGQIGEHLGFLDSAYFARYFKKETAISPTEFRNQ